MHSPLPRPLILLAACAAAAQAASAGIQHAQLVQLVARVVAQPTNKSAQRIPVEGYRFSIELFSRGGFSALVPKKGAKDDLGVVITPDSLYQQDTGVNRTTARQRKADDNQDTQYIQLSPNGVFFGSFGNVVTSNIDRSDATTGMGVFVTSAGGQPYYGYTQVRNANDTAVGRFEACRYEPPDYGLYSTDQGSPTDPNCADIRLLPECAGNFTAGTAPALTQAVPCYVNASAVAIPSGIPAN